MNWFKIVLIGIVIIAVDIAIYIFFGMLLMNYDDFYEESKGEYWSWFSINTIEQLTVVGLNFLHLVNIMITIYFIYRVYKLITSKRKNVLQHSI